MVITIFVRRKTNKYIKCGLQEKKSTYELSYSPHSDQTTRKSVTIL
jgi:hypothetical protein